MSDQANGSTSNGSANGSNGTSMNGHHHENGDETNNPTTSMTESMYQQWQQQRGSMRAPDMQLGKCKWVRVYDNVTYIAVAIVFREHNGQIQMLLIQEAKKKCYGKWYLPAGHVEPGETIEDSVKRELKEESGYDSKVKHMICMEVTGSGWYRMSYMCEITGGELKTKPDKESLSAGWFNVEDIRNGGVNLRSNDFLKVVTEALRFREWEKGGHSFAPIMNVNSVQPGLFIEFVIVKRLAISGKIEVLVHHTIENESQLLKENHYGFPTVEFGFEYFFATAVSKSYRHILEDGHTALDMPREVLGTWCLPAPINSLHHGLRVRVFCPHKSGAKARIVDERRYHWLEVQTNEVLEKLGQLENQFLPKLLMR